MTHEKATEDLLRDVLGPRFKERRLVMELERRPEHIGWRGELVVTSLPKTTKTKTTGET